MLTFHTSVKRAARPQRNGDFEVCVGENVSIDQKFNQKGKEESASGKLFQKSLELRLEERRSETFHQAG